MALNIAKVEITAIPKSTQTSFLEVVILLVVIGLFYWFMVSPKIAVLDTAKEQQNKLQIQQESSAKDLKTLKELVIQLEASKAEIDKLDQALPLDNKTLRLQMLLEYLAGTSGLTVGGISVSGKGDVVVAGDKVLLSQPFEPKRTLQKITGGIFVTGTYEQLQAFLKKLESSGRIIDVTSLDIGPAQEGLLGLRLSIDSYYFIP